jgi:hypothetical protein
MLFVYEIMVNRRQEKTMQNAINTTRFVSTLFPEAVRERLMEDAQQAGNDKNSKENFNLDEVVGSGGAFKTKPIADFFPGKSTSEAETV